MNIIKKIFNGQFDEEVHSDFLKFSRGEFNDKYLIEGKRQKDSWVIRTSAEFANFLVRSCLKDAGNRVSVKGVIVTTLDLKNEIKFDIKKVSNFQGIKKIEIEADVNTKDIEDLMNKYPKVFFALSFKTKSCELKIKPKAPKSGKPGSKGDDEGPRADFCTLKTNDKSIVEDLFFGYQDFKDIKIRHKIKINEIIYPKDLKNIKPEEVRKNSKRKGVLIREVKIDGKNDQKETDFLV